MRNRSYFFIAKIIEMKTLKYILPLIAGFLLIGACTDDFEEINTNPNEPSEVPASFLISTVQKRFMDDTWDEWMNGRFGLLYAQYWAQNQYSEESQYGYRPSVVDSYWNYYYAGRGTTGAPPTGGGLVDLQEVININNENHTGAPSDNQIGIARIFRAYMFQVITDIWGDVPYFEALGGAENKTPAYTLQSEIYYDLLNEINEGLALLNESAGAFGASDLIYGSDIAAWKKFGNSLKMRVAMRMADRDNATAKAAVEAAFNAGVFESNADNALMNYLDGQPNNNPINQDRIERGDADFAVSKTLLDKMAELNDPRMPHYADPAVTSGEFVGLTYGLDPANSAAIPSDDVSQPSGADVIRGDVGSFTPMDVCAPTSPGVYMDYAEVCFILAEAIERGYSVSGTAQEWYNAGIQASMEYWGQGSIAQSDIDDYLAQATVDYNTQTGTFKEKIGVQKWLAMYMQGIQGWTEWRRLDFGVFVEPEQFRGGATGIPLRYPYPTLEQSVNGDSYNAAIQNQTDTQNARVWWDMN